MNWLDFIVGAILGSFCTFVLLGVSVIDPLLQIARVAIERTMFIKLTDDDKDELLKSEEK